MTRSIFTVRGNDAVAAKFARLGQLVSDLTLAFDKVGREVVADARSLAPRKTGRLASSIRLERGKTFASISANTPYAGVQNYGWRRRNISGTYFLNRAADTKADSAAEALAEQIRRQINVVGL